MAGEVRALNKTERLAPVQRRGPTNQQNIYAQVVSKEAKPCTKIRRRRLGERRCTGLHGNVNETFRKARGIYLWLKLLLVQEGDLK